MEHDSEEDDSQEGIVLLTVVLTVLVTEDRKDLGSLVEKLLFLVETIILLIELAKVLM